MKVNLSILALFMCIYTFSQNLDEVSAELSVFPPKEVFIDISNLSAEDNYEKWFWANQSFLHNKGRYLNINNGFSYYPKIQGQL